MDNLRNFFGRFVWKSEIPEAKPEDGSKISTKENTNNPDSHMYTFKHPPGALDDDFFVSPFNPNRSRDEGDPFSYNPSQRPSFMFGDLFSTMGEMFREVERSMHDMNQFFEGSEFFNQGDFKTLDITPHGGDDIVENWTIAPQPKRKSNMNVRDQMLKSAAPLSVENKVDTDLDELYKANKLDLKELPLLSDEENSPSTQIVQLPRPNQSFGTRTSSQSSYSYINGKWQLKEKIIKETNEGREVTTRTTNEKGEVDTITEFFTSGSSGVGAIKPFDNNDDEFSKMSSLLGRFFRPRM